MRLTQVQSTLVHLGEQMRPKTTTERQWRAFWTGVMLLAVLAIYGVYLYTSS